MSHQAGGDKPRPYGAQERGSGRRNGDSESRRGGVHLSRRSRGRSRIPSLVFAAGRQPDRERVLEGGSISTLRRLRNWVGDLRPPLRPFESLAVAVTGAAGCFVGHPSAVGEKGLPVSHDTGLGVVRARAVAALATYALLRSEGCSVQSVVVLGSGDGRTVTIRKERPQVPNGRKVRAALATAGESS